LNICIPSSILFLRTHKIVHDFPLSRIMVIN
jgi:hypothetical protein